MRVVAKRESFAGALYVFGMLLSLVALAFAIFQFNIFTIIFAVAFVFLFLGLLIDYFGNPKTPITLNEQNEIVLHNGIILKASDIIDVSYLGEAYYLWGTLDIFSKRGNFRYRYISDREGVTKYLLKIKYRDK